RIDHRGDGLQHEGEERQDVWHVAAAVPTEQLPGAPHVGAAAPLPGRPSVLLPAVRAIRTGLPGGPGLVPGVAWVAGRGPGVRVRGLGGDSRLERRHRWSPLRVSRTRAASAARSTGRDESGSRAKARSALRVSAMEV